MAENPGPGVESEPKEKRGKRLAMPRPKRQAPQSSPVVLVLAMIGGVLLVIGALVGGSMLNRGTPETGKKASPPAKEAPAPPKDAAAPALPKDAAPAPAEPEKR